MSLNDSLIQQLGCLTFSCVFILFSDDKNLPSVPPLQLSVPADYPDQSPYWADDGEQYGETTILL